MYLYLVLFNDIRNTLLVLVKSTSKYGIGKKYNPKRIWRESILG